MIPQHYDDEHHSIIDEKNVDIFFWEESSETQFSERIYYVLIRAVRREKFYGIFMFICGYIMFMCSQSPKKCLCAVMFMCDLKKSIYTLHGGTSIQTDQESDTDLSIWLF